ncbi:DUF4347 domain-containing protein, partial [Gammaproteobacteria bacterium AH-315-E17]|nr:DUF4347 domain-containing protein [Gammaproteobacteria bacterium AH-315-E17]
MKKKIRFQQLEARVLLDAAGLATAVEGMDDPGQLPDAQDHSTDELDAGLVAHLKGDVDGKDSVEASPLLIESTALVVVDTTIENFESLIADLSDDTEILLLEGDEDGLDQIASYVEGRDDISSIHILSHGDTGEIRLGNTTIDSDTLTERADTFAKIGEALTEEGDILLYGCDIADGEAGIDFVSRLAMVTGADVAASNDLTGSAELGGDWELEHQSGDIESNSLLADGFDDVLDFNPTDLVFDGFTYLGGTGTDTTDDYSLGDSYLFEDVDAGNSVDAVVTIIGFYNSDPMGVTPNVDTFWGLDYDPGGAQSDDWLPVMNNMGAATNITVSITYKVEFFAADAGTGTQDRGTALSVDTNLTVFDLDGDADPEGGSEQIKVTAPTVSVVIAGGADLPTVENEVVTGPGTVPGATFDYDATYENGQTTIHLSNTPGALANDFDYDEHWAATFQIEDASEFIIESIVVIGSNGSPSDRATGIHFADVTFTAPETISIPILDLDLNDSSGATDLDFDVATVYKSGDGSIAITDADLGITDSDPDATTLQSATISIANAQAGDVLSVGSLPGGISASGSGTTSINLSGVATIAQYEAALQAITFVNNNAIVDGTDRAIEFTVNNGDIDSPVATTTLMVFGTPTIDTLTTISSQPVITGTWDDTQGTDLTVTVNGISYTLLGSSELTETSPGVWELDLTGVQSLPVGTYNISAVATDGVNDTSDATTSEVTILGEPEWSLTGSAGVVEGASASYAVSLSGSDGLTTGESVSVVLSFTDIDTTSADYADFDTAITTAIGARTDLAYDAATNTLTYTSPLTGTAMPGLNISLAITGGDGDSADEDYSITLTSPNSSDVSTTNDVVTTTITDTDEAPTVTATDVDPTFNEGDGSAADIFSGITVSTIEASQTIEELVFTVTNIVDGSDEVMDIDGYTVSLTNGNSGSTSGNGYTYSVSVNGSNTATVTITTTGATETEIETLIDNLGYRNNVIDNPTAGDRDVTITSITDSGTSGGGNQNTRTTGLPATSSVTVVAINDAPVVLEPSASLEAFTAAAIDIHGEGFSAADVDVGAIDTVTLTLTAGDGVINVAAGDSGVTVTGGNGTGTVTVTGYITQIDDLLVGGGTGTITYARDPAWVSGDGNDTFTVTVNDGGGTGTDPGISGDGSSEEGSESITIARIASAGSVIADFADTFTYDEGDGAVMLDQGVAASVTDADSADFDGGRLIIAPSGNVTAEDRFSIDETGDFNITVGGDLEYFNGVSTVVIGSVSAFDEVNGGFISFNANADPTSVAALIQSLTYENIETTDPTTTARTVDLTLEDGDGGTSLDYTVTINVNAVNEAPVIDLDVNDSSGVGAGGFKSTFIAGAVNIVDSDSSFSEPESDPITLKIVTANLADGANEILNFGAAGSISMEANGSLLNVSVAGVDVDIVYTFATNTFSITAEDGVSGLSSVDATAVMEAVTYQNNAGSPTATPARTFTITANDGSLTSNAAVSTIEINVAPEVDLDAAGDYTTAFTEDGSPVNIVDVATASVIDDNSDDVILTIVAGSGTNPDGALETLTIGTETFTLDATTQAFGDVDVGGVSVDIFYDGATKTFTVVDSDGSSPISAADATTVLKNITYNNASDTPTTSPDRTFTITANDGNTDSVAVISTITVSEANDPPAILDLQDRNSTYVIGNGAILIDQSAVSSVLDPEGNFDGGTLTVHFATGSSANDTLGVQSVGTGAGEISVSGSDVLYEGTVIGTFTGGAAGTDLVFTFDSDATNVSISALLHNLTFDYAGSVTGDRELEFTLVDDDSSASNVASLLITIGNDVVAADDGYSIDSDEPTISITAPGILSNDSNAEIPGPTLNFGAATAGGSTWGTDTGVSGFDWGLSGQTYNASAGSTYPGITSSYSFSGSSSGGTTASFDGISGDPSNNDATFEMWIKPDSLSGGDQVLFESGATGDGIVIYLQNDVLNVYVKDGGVNSTVTYNLNTDSSGIFSGSPYSGDPTAEFFQVSAVVDLSNTIKLYINGVEADSTAFSGVDWAGGNAAGLGQDNGGSANGITGSFDGEIARFRFYEEALPDTHLAENFGIVSGTALSLTVTQMDAETNEANDVGGSYGDIDWAADGSFVYTIDSGNTTVSELQLGSTLTDTFTYTTVDAEGNSDTATITITINGTSTGPVVDLDINDDSGAIGKDYFDNFIMGVDSSVAIADSDISLTDPDDMTFPTIEVTIGGVLDGANETLTIGGTAFDLSANTGITTVTVGGIDYDISINSGVVDINKTGGAYMSNAQILSVLGDITYENALLGGSTEGERTFDIVVSDGANDSPIATSTINVTNPDAVPPSAVDDTATLDEAGSINFNLTANDTDVGTGILNSSINIISGPAHGALIIVGDGTVTYTHDGGEDTSDTFTYNVTDKVGNVSTNTATVTLNINAVNDAPIILSLDGETLGYELGGPAQQLDSGGLVTVIDPDSIDFDTGNLFIDFASAGTGNDQLTVNNQGTGAGQIGVSGSTITFGGVTIGTIDVTNDGVSGNPLEIDFNSNATPAAVSALLQNIYYQNSGTASFSTGIEFTLMDGDGATSDIATVYVQTELKAIDDTATSNEDTVISKSTILTGVLGNDTNEVTSGASLNYEAPANSATWTTTTGVSSFDWAMTNFGSGTTYTSDAGSSLPGISSSYTMTGGATGSSGGTTTTFDSIGGETDASIEIWLKPTDLSGNEVIFETGGGTDGLAIYLNGSVLTIETRDGGTADGTVTYDLDTVGGDPLGIFDNSTYLDDPTSEFFQIGFTLEMGGNLSLFINGTVVDTDAYTGADWTGSDAAGLGRINGAEAITPVGTWDDFDGDIALFRYYESELDAGEIVENFEAVAQIDSGLSVDSAVDDDGDNIPIGSPFSTDLGATLTLNADGTYTYDPTGSAALQGLAYGETATETFTYTIIDNLGNADNAELTVTISGLDDAPVLTATGDDPLFSEGGSAVTLFSGVDLDAIEAGQTVSGLTFEVTNVTESGDEFITIDGTTISLVDASSGSTTDFSYLVSVSGSTATVVLSGGAATVADVQADIAAMTYENTSLTPTDADRTVTITQLVDSGVTTGGGQNTSALSVSSIVNVEPAAPPVNTVPGAQTVDEDSPLIITGVSVADLNNDLATTQLSVNNGTVTVSLAGGAIISSGVNGTATLTLSGSQAEINAALASITYASDADFNGADTLTILSTDSTLDTDSDVVTINVTPVVDMGDDSATTEADTPITASVTGNDAFEGTPVYVINDNAANGSVADNGSGSYTYTPDLGF